MNQIKYKDIPYRYWSSRLIEQTLLFIITGYTRFGLSD